MDNAAKGIFDVIYQRRTVRSFKTESIPEEHIMKILNAARFAPSAGNSQPWKFVVIRDKPRLNNLTKLLQSAWVKKVSASNRLSNEDKKSYRKNGKEAISRIMVAPVYIIILVDTSTHPDYALHNGCLAAENLMLAARALGYGTGFFTTYFPEGLVKSFIKAPDSLKFICAVPIGKPEQWPEVPSRKDLDELIIYDSFEGDV